MDKLTQVLTIVNRWESTGKLFFNRNSDSSMSIFIRNPELWGGNPNTEHWYNAQQVQTAIHQITKNTSEIKIDKQSGNLILTVNKIYPKETV